MICAFLEMLSLRCHFGSPVECGDCLRDLHVMAPYPFTYNACPATLNSNTEGLGSCKRLNVFLQVKALTFKQITLGLSSASGLDHWTPPAVHLPMDFVKPGPE